MQRTELKFIADTPPGYTWVLGPHNTLVAVHPEKPVLYFDESMLMWMVLSGHISEVVRARKAD